MKLYKVEAHLGSMSSIDYYVVAEGADAATKAVTEFHKKNQMYEPEYFDIQDVAGTKTYSKPHVLLLPEQENQEL